MKTLLGPVAGGTSVTTCNFGDGDPDFVRTVRKEDGSAYRHLSTSISCVRIAYLLPLPTPGVGHYPCTFLSPQKMHMRPRLDSHYKPGFVH